MSELSGFAGLVDDSWLPVLQPLDPQLARIGQTLRTEAAEGHRYHPAPDRILRAFELPIDRVRVLIMGQDPYPTPGHAVGLSFSVAPEVAPLPRSLSNIFAELQADLGCGLPRNGDLTKWFEQGVMLLNRVLTVRSGSPASHRHLGWQSITDAAIAGLGARVEPLVAILWGNDAQQVAPLLAGHQVFKSAHPSPLSASRGFFGSRPFSRTNDYLVQRGLEPIDWQLN